MGEFKEIVGSFMLAAIIFISLFSFSISIQSQNNSSDPLTNNAVFNNTFNALTSSAQQSSTTAQSEYGVFSSETPQIGFGSILLFSIVSVGNTFSSIVFGTFTALIRLPLVVFGIPSTIYGLILTWLIILIIVAVWLLYKWGG